MTRNVIVTGGSRGIGLAVARRLASDGFQVLAVARRESDQLKAAIAAAEKPLAAEKPHPGAIRFVAFDLAEVERIPDLVKTLRRDFGPVYGLVNNAAVGHNGVLASMHNSRIEELIRLNTLSPFVLTKYVVRHMMAARSGRIVNLASINAFTGYNGLSVYAATKAALIGFTRSLAREVGQLDVTVNAVAPGFLQTDMTQSLEVEQREQIARRSALRRLADVEDVAAAVAYLMSESAKNVTGTVLTVDAGSTA
jgi:3-oxoacyl-[acyl-carrier protein] reductase